MPWYEFEPDTVAMGRKQDSKNDRLDGSTVTGAIQQYGLEAKAFTSGLRDAFIWHGAVVARRSLAGGVTIDS